MASRMQIESLQVIRECFVEQRATRREVLNEKMKSKVDRKATGPRNSSTAEMTALNT